VIERKLVCASSNYPDTPQTSSVEIFDTATMAHTGTVALGPGTGSLTWVERHDGFWWATFANYDGRGGDIGRDHRSTVLVKFDDDWRRLGAWLFPETVLARFAPRSSSGGVWGDDGRLYVTGHDEQELYVLALPDAGGRLIHVATIPIAAHGQAIAWGGRDRTFWGIDRDALELIEMRLPVVP
jgi:outer membrane protein assembly factor BamB